MAKVTIADIPSGFASTTSLNTAFNQLETELNNKVLYRDNPIGEPNQMENDLDMNSNNLLNVANINGVSATLLEDLDAAVAAAEADAVATAADRIQTGLDAVATAADRVAVESALTSTAFQFTFNDTITMADPGTGNFRFNDATLGSVTAVALSATSADTGNPDVSDYIITWDDSTNTIKGHIVLRKSGTPATFAIFSITSVTDNTTWLELSVSHVDSGGTWSASDLGYIGYLRAGDKGADGAGVGDFLADGSVPMTGLLEMNKSANIAAAATTDLGTATGNSVTVTNTAGDTSISSFGGASLQAGTTIDVIFSISGGTITLTYNATNLWLPTQADLLISNGDTYRFLKMHDSNAEWRCIGGMKADGTAISSAYSVDYLVVAGGAGGGAGLASFYLGGGGGGGGVRESSISVQGGTAYTVTVGAGGAANSDGNDSAFGAVIADGGGHGGTGAYPANGNPGGSGGGGTGGGLQGTGGAGTGGQGNNGGNGYGESDYDAGGGGGAQEAGNTDGPGYGGDGVVSSISGSPETYGGGGAGAASSGGVNLGGDGGGGNGALASSNDSTAGTANTGGGGGGGSAGTYTAAKAGGSGKVIIRYPGAQRATGGTVTSAGGYTIHTFTSSGTFTA